MITGGDVGYKYPSSEETAVGNLFYPLWKNIYIFLIYFLLKTQRKETDEDFFKY